MEHVMSVQVNKLKANALRMFLIKQFTNTCQGADPFKLVEVMVKLTGWLL